MNPRSAASPPICNHLDEDRMKMSFHGERQKHRHSQAHGERQEAGQGQGGKDTEGQRDQAGPPGCSYLGLDPAACLGECRDRDGPGFESRL